MISRISKLLSKGILNILLSIIYLVLVIASVLYRKYVIFNLLFSFKRYIKYYDYPTLCFYYDKVSNIHIVYRLNKKAVIHEGTSRARSIFEILDYITDKDIPFTFKNYLYSFRDLPKEAQDACNKHNSKLYKELVK